MVYTIEQLKQKIAPVAVKYNLPAVYIFGSYARNEATESSDIDVLIDKSGSSIHGLFDLGGLYDDLYNCMGKEIDLITTATLEQESTKLETPWFVDSLQKERVLLYERQ